MKKVGRRRALQTEQVQEVLKKLAIYSHARRTYSPGALCRDYGISLTTLRMYARGLHKRARGEAELHTVLTAQEVDALLTESHSVSSEPMALPAEPQVDEGEASSPARAVA